MSLLPLRPFVVSRAWLSLAKQASLAAVAWLGASLSLHAQILRYPDPCLDYVYPAGAVRGSQCEVELGGVDGLAGATAVLVEGPPGVTVSDVKALSGGEVRATFTIAMDAPLGRRRVRVLGGANGLTNFRYFFVGKLPEVNETEPNDTAENATSVTLPVVVNGRIQASLDVDYFRFEGRQGMPLVAAIMAHAMDSKLRQTFNLGFLDASLELLDSRGNIVAVAEDTVGLDPVLECRLPHDGAYTLRVQSLGFKGSKSCVYRLTLGDVAYPTAYFPLGGRRGETVSLELAGPGVRGELRQSLTITAEPFPLEQVVLVDERAARPDIQIERGDYPEIIEQQGSTSEMPVGLAIPATFNGRFSQPGESDWLRVSLTARQAIIVRTTAQRHFRLAVDTVIAIHDSQGKTLAENDDGPGYANQAWHDFASADSWLAFTAPADGDYLISVRDTTGAAGPAAAYRLTVEPLRPDFALCQWPDAVPVWGPGTTACLVVQVFHWGGITGDIRLQVEGLPEGWKGSVVNAPYNYFSPYTLQTNAYSASVLVSITAPENATIGTLAPFRVVGTTEVGGQTLARVAQPLTLYGNAHNDRMFLRLSPDSRAVVAPPFDCRLETTATELEVDHGGLVNIPVRVTRIGEPKEIGIGVDSLTVAAGSGWRPPITLKPDQNELTIPLNVSPELRPGLYTIFVSRSWAADLRAGRPGPCTSPILLRIREPKK